VLSRRLPISRIDWGQPWAQSLSLLGLGWVLLLALFHRDLADMAAIWWGASTYTHCLFIPFITGWLVVQRAPEIKHLTPRLWWPGLTLFAAAVILWMLGEAAGIALFRHAALVLMLQSSVAVILGRHVAQVLLFPLFYLSFLVPFGEEMVPLLQTITAKLCMMFLALVGIPAHIEGVFITTPAGLFEVAEACSGVKFLVAMAAYATLAANVCFRSWARRIGFLIFAMASSVIANGIRAFGTIWISEKTGIEFAASFDHVIYGWFFFGFVMIAVMAAAWKFFDRSVNDLWLSRPAVDVAAKRPAVSPVRGLAALMAVALAGVAWQAGMGAIGRTPVDHLVTLPEVPGWTRVAPDYHYPWSPRFDGADHRLEAHYRNDAGQRVDLIIALYGWQEEGREVVGYGQGAFDPNSEWSWTRATDVPDGGKADLIFAPGAEREVASFYVMGGVASGSATRVKLRTLAARLTGQDQAAVGILVSAENRPGQPSRPAIDAFLRSLGPVGPLSTRLVASARGQ